MKLVGMMAVRNEDWCLGLTLRAALTWCDEVVVYLHACADLSHMFAREVLRDNPRRVRLCDQYDPTWDEMRHRREMLMVARSDGATHLAIIDADEILTGNQINSTGQYDGCSLIRARCAELGPGEMLCLPGYNLRGGTTHYHSDGTWGNRWFSVVFADDPRLHWTGDCFHHREPLGLELKPVKPVSQHHGGVMHLWGVSERRLKAKHALYKITERLRWPDKTTYEINAMYDQWKQIVSFAKVPDSWWAPYEKWWKYLDVNKEPWQEAECRRLIEEHGGVKFKGLDLFGVA